MQRDQSPENKNQKAFGLLTAKYKKEGLSALSDQELLEFLFYRLNSRMDASACAKKLLKTYQSPAQVFASSKNDLVQNGGLSENAALFVSMFPDMVREVAVRRKKPRSLLASYQETENYLFDYFIGKQIECFYMLCLDKNNRVLRCDKLGEGDAHEVLVNIKKICAIISKTHADSIVIAHNHPKGDSRPSKADYALTCRVSALSRTLGAHLRDHIIFAPGETFSMLKNDDGALHIFSCPYPTIE